MPVFIKKRSFYLFSILVVTVWICYFIVYSENKYIDKNIEKNVIKPVAKSSDGEMGNPVILPNDLPPEIFSKIEQGWKDYQFNVYVSDMINLHRSLPDHRNELCMLPFRYEIKLPPTSIIISFYNEAWSVLLRSIYSILERTPPRLIKEIILVDDFSDMTHLKKQLEDHLESETKVKIIRNEKREGLIRSRLIGSDLAQGEILIFLDSHIEVTQGWLEPLLERIRLNYTNVACPIIDMINPKTFEYVPVKETNVGGFDWNLIFTWHQIPRREVERRYDEAEPVFTPTMSGIFAISKRFFEEIGRYDDGLEIWGGDNLELSFKIWMCGGSLEIIPCSRVGHIFRHEFPYNVLDEKTHFPVTMKNFQRVAETWLDEYKTFYYQRIGNQNNIYDDLKERKALRKSLKCESFQWYLDKIYPEKFVPKNLYGYGLIGTVNRKYCLDSWGDLYTFVQLKKCLSTSFGGSQFWYYTNEKEIRKDDVCLEYNPEINDYVSLYPCDGIYDSRQWDYDPVTNFFIHIKSEKCMGIDGDEVVLTACDYSDAKQQWFIENVNRKSTS